MNPIQKFIVINLFENTPEVFKFIHRMNIARAKKKVENIAFKYNDAKMQLYDLSEIEPRETYLEDLTDEEFANKFQITHETREFIKETDEQIARTSHYNSNV